MKDPAITISKKNLAATAECLRRSPLFVPRLEWWLLGGHSSERWLQFEWAYWLHQRIQPDHAALCEINRVDVSIVPVDPKLDTLWEERPEARIELKWWGNRWVDEKSIAVLRADVDKVGEFRCPAAAILLFLEVDPLPTSRHHAWLARQIAQKHGVSGLDGLESRLAENLGSEVNYLSTTVFDGGALGPRVELHTLGFYNEAAAPAYPSGGPMVAGP